MQLRRINRTDPEKIFALGLNVGATTLTNGHVIAFANASTTPAATAANLVGDPTHPKSIYPGFGVEVVICPVSTATNLVARPCGVWTEASSVTGTWGLYQIYGVHNAIQATAGTMVNAALVASASAAGKVDDGPATVANDPRILVGYPAVAWSATAVQGFITLM